MRLGNLLSLLVISAAIGTSSALELLTGAGGGGGGGTPVHIIVEKSSDVQIAITPLYSQQPSRQGFLDIRDHATDASNSVGGAWSVVIVNATHRTYSITLTSSMVRAHFTGRVGLGAVAVTGGTVWAVITATTADQNKTLVTAVRDGGEDVPAFDVTVELVAVTPRLIKFNTYTVCADCSVVDITPSIGFKLVGNNSAQITVADRDRASMRVSGATKYCTTVSTVTAPDQQSFHICSQHWELTRPSGDVDDIVLRLSSPAEFIVHIRTPRLDPASMHAKQLHAQSQPPSVTVAVPEIIVDGSRICVNASISGNAPTDAKVEFVEMAMLVCRKHDRTTCTASDLERIQMISDGRPTLDFQRVANGAIIRDSATQRVCYIARASLTGTLQVSWKASDQVVSQPTQIAGLKKSFVITKSVAPKWCVNNCAGVSLFEVSPTCPAGYALDHNTHYCVAATNSIGPIGIISALASTFVILGIVFLFSICLVISCTNADEPKHHHHHHHNFHANHHAGPRMSAVLYN